MTSSLLSPLGDLLNLGIMSPSAAWSIHSSSINAYLPPQGMGRIFIFFLDN